MTLHIHRTVHTVQELPENDLLAELARAVFREQPKAECIIIPETPHSYPNGGTTVRASIIHRPEPEEGG